jgi:hypothetical protein
MMRSRRLGDRLPAAIALAVMAAALGADVEPTASAQTPPPDRDWQADAELVGPRKVTDSGLGACQGIAVRDGRIYAYGDVYSATPRVGVMREYNMDLEPTGREIWLRQAGRPLIIHPTGLTWDERWGTLLGDTVNKKAKIYRLDWNRAWSDGNLDQAVVSAVDDDAAINGCRPTFVSIGGRTLIATADYGDVHPEIRLYDPELLFKAGRSSAPGVVVHRVLCGAFNQNLHWDAVSGRLTCVQNVIEGRGWRLDIIDLAKGIADGRSTGPGVRIQTLTFAPHDELEGYWPLGQKQSLFVTSRREGNIVVAVFRPSALNLSPAGTQ